MPAPFTCFSKDALSYCQERALDIGWGRQPSGYFTPPEGLLEAHYEKLLLNSEIWSLSETSPLKITADIGWDGREGKVISSGFSFWIFKNRAYTEERGLGYSDEEKRLLLMEEFDKERRKFEKLRSKFTAGSLSEHRRPKIPSDVRIFVWQRDNGRCAECKSNESLEYDHIIPFSKGGSNTGRNLQLLCGTCNRLKSDNIQ